MAYRNDLDLEFLGQLRSEDLNDLVYCLTHDKDGQIRLTEELTQSDIYKQYYPNHIHYWKLIAAEIQCFGANTFATWFRLGEGVVYKEVLTDVCDKLGVNYNKNSSIERIENYLLMKILEDALENMSVEDIRNLADSLGMNHTDMTRLTPELFVGIFQAVFQAGGFKSYQLTVIIANAVMKAIFGKGLTFAANATLTKTMSVLTGPIGWVITGLWTAIDVAGPAYRVTVPSVIHVAVLRKKFLYAKQASMITFN